MNFKKYLLNEDRMTHKHNAVQYKDVFKNLKEDAIFTIKKHCSEILQVYKNSKARIYRGMPLYKSRYIGADSSEIIRKSANTSNYYTTIFSEHPSWSDFPKRSKSYICTNEYVTSHYYGLVYLAFPINGTKIGICPENDMWYSFEKIVGKKLHILDLPSFFDNLNYIKKYFLNQKKSINDSSLIKMKEEINQLGIDIKNNEFSEEKNQNCRNSIRQLIISYKKSSDSLFDYIIKSLDPYKNGFEVVTTSNYPFRKNSSEVWFSGKCIFIRDENPKTDPILNKF
jgi:hypothetical protein